MPPSNPNKPGVSVGAELYAKLREAARARGISMIQLVADALAPPFSMAGVPIRSTSKPAPKRQRKPRRRSS